MGINLQLHCMNLQSILSAYNDYKKRSYVQSGFIPFAGYYFVAS